MISGKLCQRFVALEPLSEDDDEEPQEERPIGPGFYCQMAIGVIGTAPNMTARV